MREGLHYCFGQTPGLAGRLPKSDKLRQWALEIQKGTRMNADERRPGMVARCAKVDEAFLEAVLWAGDPQR